MRWLCVSVLLFAASCGKSFQALNEKYVIPIAMLEEQGPQVIATLKANADFDGGKGIGWLTAISVLSPKFVEWAMLAAAKKAAELPPGER